MAIRIISSPILWRLGSSDELSDINVSSAVQSQSAIGISEIELDVSLSSAVQSQSAVGASEIELDITIDSSAQAQNAIATADIDVSNTINVSSSVQSQNAISEAEVDLDISLSSSVQSQSALSNVSIGLDVSITSDTQAQSAIALVDITIGNTINVSSSVQSQSAIGTSDINIDISITSNVQSQSAIAAASIEISVPEAITSVRTKMRKALKSCIKEMTIASGYNFTYTDVFDPPINMEKMTTYPTVNIIYNKERRLGEKYIGNDPIFDILLPVQFDIFLYDINDTSLAQDKAIADFQRYFGRNYYIKPATGSRTVFNCIWSANDIWGTEREVPNCGVSVELDVYYSIRKNDPTLMI